MVFSDCPRLCRTILPTPCESLSAVFRRRALTGGTKAQTSRAPSQVFPIAGVSFNTAATSACHARSSAVQGSGPSAVASRSASHTFPSSAFNIPVLASPGPSLSLLRLRLRSLVRVLAATSRTPSRGAELDDADMICSRASPVPVSAQT